MKKAAIVLLTLVLLLSLTGCDSADYKKAQGLFDAGEYAQAIELFESLGEYEDSAGKALDCRAAYADALYKAGDYAAAREQWLLLPASAQTEDKLRAAAWDMVRAYLEEKGTVKESSTEYIVEDNAQVEIECQLSANAGEVLAQTQSTKVKSWAILGSKMVSVAHSTVAFNGTDAAPTLEAKETTTFSGPKDSSTFQNVGTASWDLATYKSGDTIVWTEYIHIDEDGTMHDDRTAPAFDEQISMHQTAVTAALEELLTASRLELTMADLGFKSY